MKKSTTKFLALFLEQTSTVEIEFEVEIPNEINQEHIWISGNLDVLGSWNGKGLALSKVGPRLYWGKVVVPQGSLVFYKVTRGSWDQVEVDKNGFDKEDRSFVAKENQKLKIKVEGFAKQGARSHPSTKDEHVQDLGYFGEKTTGIGRKVEIHLPPYYATEPQSYPVIYMLDGQNLFDAATAFMGQEWAADKTYDRLFEQRLIEPFIIVGIHNTHLRHDFYTPVPDPFLGEGGKLLLLEKMIHEEIEPHLISHFRIRRGPKNTGIIGSSLGGLAAFHLGWKYPERYGLIGAMSPSLWWNQYFTYDMVKRDEAKDKIRRENLKIWLDMGTRESQYMHRPLIAVSRLAYLLRKKKFNVQLYIHKDATHSERSWRKRLPQVFQWLLGKKG